MPHNIKDNKAFMSFREPAWHGLGTIMETQVDAISALNIVGDFEVHRFEKSYWDSVNKKNMPMPGKYALVTSEGKLLGECSKDYHPIQNHDIAEIINPLTEKMPVETCGVLGDGETIFFCLKGGDTEVSGDQVKIFWMVANSHKPGSSLRVVLTPVRVVCQNTLIVGEQRGSVQVRLTHTKNAKELFSIYCTLKEKMGTVEESTLKLLNALGSIKLERQEMVELLEMLFPTPKVPSRLELVTAKDANSELTKMFGAKYQANVKHAENMRSKTIEFWDKFCDEFPKTANTGWAGYNVVVEAMDYIEGRDGAKESAIFGPRASYKSKALDLVLAKSN